MQDVAEVIIWLGGAVVVLAIIGAILLSAVREKALRRWAAARDLVFDPDRQEGFDERFNDFACLREGSDRYADNLISGRWGDRSILAFDYHCTKGSGDDESQQVFSAVILEGEVELKGLLIRQETFSDKVSAFFGFDDIDFESADFSREFFVKSPDRKWAYDVLHARTMALLLRSPRFAIQLGGPHAIAWRDRRLEPGELEEAANLLAGILDALPEYVRRQQAESTPRE